MLVESNNITRIIIIKQFGKIISKTKILSDKEYKYHYNKFLFDSLYLDGLEFYSVACV